MRRALTLLSLAALAVACERVEAPPPAPAADFLVAAGDSVFWIRSEADGIRVRGAPMALALVGGRIAELYVEDDDHSFYDAVYVGQRLFKRDLITGDSVQLFADTLMRLLARSYAAANPDEQPLAATEQGSETPRTIGSAEILVLDVMGPWVSYEYRTDVEIIGRPSAHGLRHGVLDLRTGVPSTLDALFGRTQARAIIADGQRQWREVRDSVLAASAELHDAGEIRAEFAQLAFDARSFGLVAIDRQPRVRFTLAQSGAPVAAPAQSLFPIAVDTPPWWEGVMGDYPEAQEAAALVWPRAEYSIVARPAEGPAPRLAFALRDAGGQEWRLGFVPAPVSRVMWLDDSLMAPGTREALVRAFDEASLYSDQTRVASRPRRAPRAVPTDFPVSHARDRTLDPRKGQQGAAARPAHHRRSRAAASQVDRARGALRTRVAAQHAGAS